MTGEDTTLPETPRLRVSAGGPPPPPALAPPTPPGLACGQRRASVSRGGRGGLPGPLGCGWPPPRAPLNPPKQTLPSEGAVTEFGVPFGEMIDAPRHSADEERFVLLGRSDRRRLL